MPKWASEHVSEALFYPVLYNAAYAETHAPEMGYSKIFYLGKGTYFDVTSYDGYEALTVDNFIVTGQTIPNLSASASYWSSGNCTGGSQLLTEGISDVTTIVNKSYNSTTGILTAYLSTTVNVTAKSPGLNITTKSNSKKENFAVEVYLVIGSIQNINWLVKILLL